MKSGIKKPVLIFLGVVLLLSATIIIIRDIKMPYFPTASRGETKVEPKMTELKIEDSKTLLKYSELDLFITECCSDVLSDVKSRKDNNMVKISGNSSFPFTANFEGNLNPYIEDKKLKVHITNVVLGKVESPQLLSEKVANLANNTLDSKINSKYSIKDVKITDEGIEITIN